MTYEQFMEKSKAPVDIEACEAAISRAAKGRIIMRIPARIDDDDILLSRAIKELERLRELGAGLDRTAVLNAFGASPEMLQQVQPSVDEQYDEFIKANPTIRQCFTAMKRESV